ncbi:MFS family permease [Saccharothrix ecbatanensis]|uniref:MFS family permease n=1 Tax=Saccharothrix ecbatanensis TaxID=1105145 RepID=A0A7W9HEB3_9PSEU|nr:MFS transporter [Saccharothrix ecbatanensis]MBB5800386.1 MFS family permease [Saccharothrix ecbatanensis]
MGDTGTAPEAAVGRGKWRDAGELLADRRFRRFFLGYATSLIGSSMAPVAMAFAVLDTGASATALGLVFTAGVVPSIVLLLAGGVLADRVSRRTVMVVADIVCAAAQFVFAALIFTGTAELWSMMLLAAVRGGAAAFYQPAMAAMPPDLVKPDRLQRANSFLALAKAIPDVAGPAVAGVLVVLGGSGVVLVVDGVSYLLSAVFLAGVRVPRRVVPARASVVRDLREGWTEFRSRRWVWTGVVQFALWNMAVVAPFMVLGPVIARNELGGAWAWGTIAAAQGAGAVLAGVVLLRVRVRRPLVTIVVVQLSWVLLLGFLALRLSLPVVAVAAFAVGIGSGVFIALWRTTEQTLIPRDVLSRVTSYELLGAYALGPVGLAVVGPVSDALGIAPVLWFGVAWQLLSSAAILLLPEVRSIRLDRS